MENNTIFDNYIIELHVVSTYTYAAQHTASKNLSTKN